MSQKIQSANQWVTLIANLAVLAGILVFVYELRQTQLSLQSGAYQSRSFQAYDFHWSMSERPDVDILFLSIVDDLSIIDSLDSEDLSIITNISSMTMIDADNEHYQYQNGFLDEDFYRAVTIPEIQVFAPIWRKLGVTENRADFRELVDGILSGSITPQN